MLLQVNWPFFLMRKKKSCSDLPLLDHVAENPHHALGLLFREAFLFQSLHKLERVEVMVLGTLRGCTEVASKRQSRCIAACILW